MFALAVYDTRKERGKGNGEGVTGTKTEGENASRRDARGPIIQDARSDGTLFLARDRMGIKPLYYYAPGLRVPPSEFRVEAEPGRSEMRAVQAGLPHS